MIYKVEEETGTYTTSGLDYTHYKIWSKPFKYFPFWTYVDIAFSKHSLGNKITALKSNPVYRGTINQIFEQVKNF